MFVEVLQHAFAFRQDEPPAEVLTVVSAPFPQKALSVPCREESHMEKRKTGIKKLIKSKFTHPADSVHQLMRKSDLSG